MPINQVEKKLRVFLHIFRIGIDSLLNSSRSSSTLNLSSPSSSSLNQSILETQLKRANSSNETLEASLKRLRTETQNTIEDFQEKNEVDLLCRFSPLFFFAFARL